MFLAFDLCKGMFCICLAPLSATFTVFTATFQPPYVGSSNPGWPSFLSDIALDSFCPSCVLVGLQAVYW